MNNRAGVSEYLTKAFNLRDRASEREQLHIPSLYYLTVTGELDKAAETRQVVIVRVGDDVECFHRAAELCVKVNFETLQTPIQKAAVYLDPHEFHAHGQKAGIMHCVL